MKNKKKPVIIISAIVIVVAVTVTLLLPKLKYGFSNISINEYLSQDLIGIDSVGLISECAEVDGKSDSVSGFKEAVRLGADSVIVDLCFKKDGTPVICKNYSNAETSQSVEKLFKAMNEEKYKNIRVYLRIVQLSELSKLNELSSRYNVLNRLFLIGIDKEHYGLLSSDETGIPFFIDYTFTDDELKSVTDNKFTPPQEIEKNGAVGIIIDRNQISPELIDYLDGYEIPFITDNIKNDKELCISLLNGSRDVIVKDIERSKSVIDVWTENMQERFESSVSQSLNDLSKPDKKS
ncbi:MAG: hypothetical protein KBT46_06325 [Ruminococcus sp.]|nr:hypothetical protein [Candidatus Copronaster equi]